MGPLPGRCTLGGAPANFAIHAAALGARSAFVSRVGMDPMGDGILEALRVRGVDEQFVRRDRERPTGTVNVALEAGEPTYEIVEGVAWDHILWAPGMEGLAAKARAVCFGTLGQRCPLSRRTIQRLVASTPETCLRVLDINFRRHYHSAEVVHASLCTADLLKLSEEEVPILREYLGGIGDEAAFLLDLRDRFDTERVVLTLGAGGCRVLGPEGDIRVPSPTRKVLNTVGAGDVFAAAFVLHLLAGADGRTCAERANRAGGYVVAQDSGTPEFPEEFRVFGR